MKISLVTGIVGIILCFVIAKQTASLSFLEVLYLIFVNQCAVLIALLSTLQLEKFLRKKNKSYLNRGAKIWTFLSLLYFSILFSLAPSFLELLKDSIPLFLSLLLSSTLSFFPFGFIQDRIVWRDQKNERRKA